MASGDAIGCFGLTEPDFGSNPAACSPPRARPTTAIVLNGAKRWITNGSIADVALVWAKLDGEVRGFLVEKGTPGFTAPRDERQVFAARIVTSELIFEDCEVPEDAHLARRRRACAARCRA